MLADVIAKLDQARAMTAELQTDYRQEYQARCREYQRKAWANYRAKHPLKAKTIHAVSSARRMVQKRPSVETTAYIKFLFAHQTKCPHCFRLLSETGKTLDHIKALANGGTHTPDNLILMCKSCNSSKGTKTNWPPDYRFIGRTQEELRCDAF